MAQALAAVVINEEGFLGLSSNAWSRLTCEPPPSFFAEWRQALTRCDVGARLAIHTHVGPILHGNKLIGSERNEPLFGTRFHQTTAAN